MSRIYTLRYWLDDGWYVGKIEEIPGVFSQGETLEELKENIIDAYKMMMIDNNEDIYTNANTMELEVEI